MVQTHPYIPNSDPAIIREMLSEIGLHSVEELFKDIPPSIRTRAGLLLPSMMSELETRRRVEAMLAKNLSTRDILSFLGGGVWPHHVPAAIDAITSRGEFLTSYTPYQPEISQGLLQAMFEYQSLICELTGMEFANSSLYDWSTALGEGARMTARVTGRYEFLFPKYVNQERLATLRAFCDPVGIKLIEIARKAHGWGRPFRSGGQTFPSHGGFLLGVSIFPRIR